MKSPWTSWLQKQKQKQSWWTMINQSALLMYLGYFCLEQTFWLYFTFTFFEQKNFYFYFLTFSKQTKTSTFTFLLFSKLLKLYFYFFTFFQTNKLLLLLFYFIPRFRNPTFTFLLFYKSGCLTFSRKFNFFLTLIRRDTKQSDSDETSNSRLSAYEQSALPTELEAPYASLQQSSTNKQTGLKYIDRSGNWPVP